MSIAEIHQLPLNEKIRIMEAIWDDLRSEAGATLTPDWHRELLDERRRGVESGKEGIVDWDDVKGSLGSSRA